MERSHQCIKSTTATLVILMLCGCSAERLQDGLGALAVAASAGNPQQQQLAIEQMQARRRERQQAQELAVAQTQAQKRERQQAEAVSAFVKATNDASQKCRDLYADPALDPIRDKVALFVPSEQTFAMRTNTSHVSKKEKPAVALWAQKRDQCKQLLAPMLSVYPAPIVAVTNASNGFVDSLVAELYLGKLTYGEFAEKRASNAAELQTSIAQIQQALAAQNQQAQFQAQQLSNQAIANWNSQMQTKALEQMRTDMLPRSSQPVHCTTFGNTTTCE